LIISHHFFMIPNHLFISRY